MTLGTNYVRKPHRRISLIIFGMLLILSLVGIYLSVFRNVVVDNFSSYNISQADFIYKGIVYKESGGFRNTDVNKNSLKKEKSKENDFILSKRFSKITSSHNIPLEFYNTSKILALPFFDETDFGQGTFNPPPEPGEAPIEEEGDYLAPTPGGAVFFFGSDDIGLFLPYVNIYDSNKEKDLGWQRKGWTLFKPNTEFIEGKAYVQSADYFKTLKVRFSKVKNNEPIEVPYVKIDSDDLVFYKGIEQEGEKIDYYKLKNGSEDTLLKYEKIGETKTSYITKYVLKEKIFLYKQPDLPEETSSYDSSDPFFDFAFNYPNNWQIGEITDLPEKLEPMGDATLYLFGPKNLEFNHYPNIAILKLTKEKGASEFKTLRQAAKNIIKSDKEFNDGRLIKKEEVSLAANPAVKIIMGGKYLPIDRWYERNDVPLLRQYVVTKNKDYLITWQYEASREDFAKYIDIFEDILKTFSYK